MERKLSAAVWIGALCAAASVSAGGGCGSSSSPSQTIPPDAALTDAEPSVDATSHCGGGTVACGDACVDTAIDPANCGACGKTCPKGNVCSSGACALACVGGTTMCAGACVSEKVDPANCGSCGNACAAGLVCSNGTCATSCGPGLTECGGLAGDGGSAEAGPVDGSAVGMCADLSVDNTNCGACGHQCPSGQVCSEGGRAVTCATSQIDCGGLCIDPLRDNQYCGASGACGAADAGSPGTSCGPGTVCNGAGVCAVTCAPQQVECNGTCIDPSSNPVYCGATAGCGAGDTGSTGTMCGAGFACVSSVCLAVANPVTAGILANYDARVLSSITQNASNDVTQWSDLSGNGNNLTNNGATPVYGASLINAHPAIDFSGGAGMITAPAGFPLNSSVTVFFVVQWQTPGSWGNLAHHGSRDADWSMEQNADANDLNAVHWQTNNDNTGCQLELSSPTNWILVGRMDPTSGRSFWAYSTATGLLSTTGSASTTLTTGSKRMYVGKSDINEPSNAFIGQLLYYNVSLSDDQVTQVLTYLRSTWGF